MFLQNTSNQPVTVRFPKELKQNDVTWQPGDIVELDPEVGAWALRDTTTLKLTEHDNSTDTPSSSKSSKKK